MVLGTLICLGTLTVVGMRCIITLNCLGTFRVIGMMCTVKVVTVVLGTLNCLGAFTVVGTGCNVKAVSLGCRVHKLFGYIRNIRYGV